MTSIRACLVVVLLAAAGAAWAQSDDRPAFTVGTAAASRGQTATGTIEVPAGSDAALSIPVAVVHGRRPGPVLALIAGSHGTEYASIIALERLMATLDATALSGTVIIVPLVNVPSFTRIVPHLNPVDGKNMNRMYPGRADGTQTDRASWAITQQVIDPSDHVIDYHGGDLDENLRPYAYWTRTGRAAQDAASRALVLAFGLDHIIISSDRPADPAASRYLENTATTRGKPSITVEAGHSGTVDPEDVAVLVNGTLGAMQHLKMLPGAPAPVEHPVWIDHLADVASDRAGIFYPAVKPGTYAEAGMKLGYVTDFVGRTVGELRAREAGVVLYVRAVPSIDKGDTVASIGVVGKAP
jgi:predicted deacylase